MKMYVINLDVWIFGRGWTRKEIWGKKTACRDMLTFSKLNKKSQVLRFVRDLVAIWNI
jgi:hypothetical protein